MANKYKYNESYQFVDVEKSNMIKKRINNSGLKPTFIAKKLNVDYPALYRKITGSRKFTIGEAIKLKCLVKMPDDEFLYIFGERYVFRGKTNKISVGEVDEDED